MSRRDGKDRGKNGNKDKADSQAEKTAFCYHCMCVGHFPRDCPVKESREEQMRVRSATIAGEKEGAKKSGKKGKKKEQPLQVPEVPTASDIITGDMAFISMVNNNALIHAVYNGDELEVRKHIRRGADLSAVDSNGLSSLHIAAIYGFAPCINVLLSNGADPNMCEPVHQRTPIFFAALHNHASCIRSLLAGGADPTKPCDSGENALDKCKSIQSRFLIEEYIKSKAAQESQ